MEISFQPDVLITLIERDKRSRLKCLSDVHVAAPILTNLALQKRDTYLKQKKEMGHMHALSGGRAVVFDHSFWGFSTLAAVAVSGI